MKVLATLKPAEYKENMFCNLYGILAEIDWDTKTIFRSLKIPMASFHDDTAFMTPLLAGLCLIGRRVFVAAGNFIVEVDYDDFRVVNAASWPPMADLHGMSTDGHDLWVAAAAIDAVLCLDANNLHLKWRWGPDEPILYQDRLSNNKRGNPVARLPFLSKILRTAAAQSDNCRFVERDYRYLHKGKTSYHYHHLNGICLHEGFLYITTKGWNKEADKSAVIRLDPRSRRSEFFVPPGGFRGMHDGIFVDGRFYTTESGANSVAWREPDGSIISRHVEPSPYFVRGLCYTGSSFLVGFSTRRGSVLPAQIAEYDPEFKRQLAVMDISMFYPEDKKTAVFALALSPDQPSKNPK
jgi:hypothetical protein